MLLYTKRNKALLVGSDVDSAAASAMLASGEAVEVKALRLSRDARFAGVDYSGSFDAGTVVRVPEDVPDHVAKTLLNPLDPVHAPHAIVNPHTVIPAERKPEESKSEEKS